MGGRMALTSEGAISALGHASTADVAGILLELVDSSGNTLGTAEKIAAHRFPGRLHRAFSVFLLDSDGHMVLQRRALTKYHFPGVWSNSCCGHPLPGEHPFVAAARRVREELGVCPAVLAEAGTVTYRHEDPQSGLVEHEYNHLFVGVVTADLKPAPEEVVDIARVDQDGLRQRRATEPFSGWFGDVFDAVLPTLRNLDVAARWRNLITDELPE